MRRRVVVVAMAALLVGDVAARADEPSEDSSGDACDPKCGSGYSCRDGNCVQTQCTPRCRSGFLCREGECRIKPKLSDVRWTDKPHRKPKPDEVQDPTVGRVYAGPMFLAVPAGGSVYALLGGTLEFQASDIAQSPFFVGVRTEFLRFTDGSGWFAALELDLGLRFRFHETKTSAAGLVLGGGIGGGGLWGSVGSVGFLHLPAHIGPFFDSGAFTFEVLFGPAILKSSSVLGLFESSVELGARF